MADKKKNRARRIYKKKCEYLETEKSFLDEIKSIFHNYLWVIICWKNKKIAGKTY